MPILMPPPQYDHPPQIPVIEHVLTSDAINRICHERHAMDMAGRPASPAYRFSGCAHLSVTSNGKSCEVWRIDDGTVRRHEFGHCNGWPADHPDAAELTRRLAEDRAAHHLEMGFSPYRNIQEIPVRTGVQKDAAANAAADAATPVRLKPPPTPHPMEVKQAIPGWLPMAPPPPVKPDATITVLKVRPAAP